MGRFGLGNENKNTRKPGNSRAPVVQITGLSFYRLSYPESSGICAVN
jgi:hypothetical protein